MTQLQDWIPGTPLKELPLPRWMFKTSELSRSISQMLEEKEQELVSLGIPPNLAKRAVRWAQEYAQGLTEMMETPESEAEIIYRRALVYGLKKSEDWAKGILKAIKE